MIRRKHCEVVSESSFTNPQSPGHLVWASPRPRRFATGRASCFDKTVAIAAKVKPPQIVGQDEDDVGPAFPSFAPRRKARQEQNWHEQYGGRSEKKSIHAGHFGASSP
jgi:hypothetical protein